MSWPKSSRALLLTAWTCSASTLGCSEPAKPGPGEPVSQRGLRACADDAVDGVAKDDSGCVTYRAIGGISMGGGAAMRIALENPALFDVAVSLGSPYIDMEYFLLSVSEVSNGGFCEREQLLSNLDVIDEKDNPATWCGPVLFEDLAIEDSLCDGFSGDFNHHYRGPEAGRGGSFGRESSFEIVHDLALAYGNPAFYNPDSSYLPPGVPERFHIPLSMSAAERRAERQMLRQQLCDQPVRLEGVYDRLYNPTGEYPVISFCDGNGPINGEFEPGTHRFPVEVTLAVDYNDNGRRDYGEPTLAQSFEHFDDFGADGLASVDEPGFDPMRNPDPAGDDYDWLKNPKGAEGNFRFDEGERLFDLGLDGVANTGDFGEDNGRFDTNPNLAFTFGRSPRALIEQLEPRMLDRLHIWADAGIRDFLLSAQITNQFWGSLMARGVDARLLNDWSGLAQIAQPMDSSTYDPRTADLSPDSIGKHAYLRYGDPSVCPGVDAESGRGNHVGTAREALDRVVTSFAFASARWPEGDFGALSGSIGDQGGPTGDLEDFVQVQRFESAALGREMPYVIVLPPDYYNAPDSKYPVMYFLHGQGQKATDLAASALLLLGPQMSSEEPDRARARRSDWQKMIIVFADGECQVGECHTGTFYMNHRGLNGDDGPKHGEAFFELMREIEQKYRTKTPAQLPKMSINR